MRGRRIGVGALVRDQQGAALMMAMLALLLLSAGGAALVLVTSADLLIADNAGASSEAFYAADAALERTIAELQVAPDLTAVLTGSVVSAFADGPTGTPRRFPGGVLIDLSAILNQANCEHPASCSVAEMNAVTRDRPWGPQNPRWRLFSHAPLDSVAGSTWSGLPSYAVSMVADDPSETDGDPLQDGARTGPAANPGAGVLLVRAEGISRRGAQRTIEATVIRHDLAARARWEAADPLTRGDPPEAHPFLQVLTWREVH